MDCQLGPALPHYPQPNPRILSTRENLLLEDYIDEALPPASAELVKAVVSNELIQKAYQFVVDYAANHNNFLPTKDMRFLADNDELLLMIRGCEKFSDIPPDDFDLLAVKLPRTGWYVHPMYPL